MDDMYARQTPKPAPLPRAVPQLPRKRLTTFETSQEPVRTLD